jgi:twitching motility protein PilT
MKFSIDNIAVKLLTLKDKILQINDLLVFATENNCSDLYIKVGQKPYINRYGKLYEISCMPINDIVWDNWAKIAITSEKNASYVREKMLDLNYKLIVPENSKFNGKYQYFYYRVSVGFSETKNIATFRMITPDLPSFNTINFPNEVRDSLKQSLTKKNGIIIISGPTGSGKTTTLASCFNDFIQENQPLSNKMIITLEDPIEYKYNCTNNTRIVQKELGSDFKTFPNGVKQALREHPNVICIGEMRDCETIQTGIEAARTGHLVISTFHTSDVPESLSRIAYYLNTYSSYAIYDLIANLNFVLCQRLTSSDDKFILETQYMSFIDQIKEELEDEIMNNGNLVLKCKKMFQNDEYIKNKIVSDWR